MSRLVFRRTSKVSPRKRSESKIVGSEGMEFRFPFVIAKRSETKIVELWSSTETSTRNVMH